MKLSQQLAKEIRQMANAGVKQRALAQLFGVERTTIIRVVQNQTFYDGEYAYKYRPRKKLDVKYCARLREAGKTYREIRLLEGMRHKRTKLFSLETIRVQINQLIKMENKKNAKFV